VAKITKKGSEKPLFLFNKIKNMLKEAINEFIIRLEHFLKNDAP
jgi:hypothetical protein